MIVCPVCSKENQDHYKFCLGCGSDLPRAGGDAKPLSTATPPAGIAAVAAPAPAPQPLATAPAPAAAPMTPVAAPAPAPEPAPVPAPAPASAEASAPQSAPQGVSCASCGASVPPGFAFCGACGTPIGGARPQPAAAAAQAAPATDSGSLILIQPDGTEGGIVEIPSSPVAVGRDAGGFFETDAYLSPRHAIFRTHQGKVVVKDEASLNGVFFKVLPNQPVEIKSGTIFRMGQELILFEAIDKGAAGPDGTSRMGSPIAGLWGRISLIIGKGRLGNSFPIGADGIVCGRERGNILFPEDGYISGVHLRIHTEGGRFFLTDLGSSNGSYIKVVGEKELASGDFILMGAQLFRIHV